MTAENLVPPKYNPELVERAVLEVVIDPDYPLLRVSDLLMMIATEPQDRTEVATIMCAVDRLKQSGLLQYRNGSQIIKPTAAALRAAALLIG